MPHHLAMASAKEAIFARMETDKEEMENHVDAVYTIVQA